MSMVEKHFLSTMPSMRWSITGNADIVEPSKIRAETP